MLKRATVLIAFLATPAFAGEPSDLVRRFYSGELSIFDEATLEKYSGQSMQAYLAELAALQAKNPDTPCIDFDPAIDAQDFDRAELDRTLKLDEIGDDTSAIVTASFAIFGEPRSVVWSLQHADGAWLITDIASADGGWRFSDMTCEEE